MTLITSMGFVPANPNLIINGGFTINQDLYTSGAVLSAGVYGHDQWKAGAAGATYTFTQLDAPTTITITAGSLIQVIEPMAVQGGSYVLSWTGTATARYGLNSATPSGSYVSSPIVITGQTAGTTLSVEFGTGTVGKVKLEMGTVVTPFVYAGYGAELFQCMRSYQKGRFYSQGKYAGGSGYTSGETVPFPVPMRTTPTITLTNISAMTVNCGNSSTVVWSDNTGFYAHRAASAVGTVGFADTYVASARL